MFLVLIFIDPPNTKAIGEQNSQQECQDDCYLWLVCSTPISAHESRSKEAPSPSALDSGRGTLELNKEMKLTKINNSLPTLTMATDAAEL